MSRQRNRLESYTRFALRALPKQPRQCACDFISTPLVAPKRWNAHHLAASLDFIRDRPLGPGFSPYGTRIAQREVATNRYEVQFAMSSWVKVGTYRGQYLLRPLPRPTPEHQAQAQIQSFSVKQ